MNESGIPRLFRRILLLWVALLFLSFGFRWWRGFEAANTAFDGDTVHCAEIPSDLGAKASGTVRIAWRTRQPDGGSDGTVVLLHGNPVAGWSMQRLAAAMPPRFRILVPDLPGFGRSEAMLHSYAARDHAPLIRAWLKRIGVDKAHWVGYSQGSAYALQLADQFPEMTESVTLLAGVGLQEYELLGDFRLNQPVYLLQYASLWSLRWLTPHFGLFDRPWMAPRSALNFRQTDLRLNRPILESIDAPVLVLHAADDRLVPFPAAKAHAMMVPQAVFRTIPGGHMAPMSEDAAAVAASISVFLESVEHGKGLTRQNVAEKGPAEKPGLLREATVHSPLVKNLFFGILLFFLVFVSEDLSCIAGGLLAANGSVSLLTSVSACFFGIWVSDIGLYLLGYVFGPGIFKIGFIRSSAEGGRVKHFVDAYASRGARIVFLTRFIPGSRVIAYVTAGVFRIGIFRFALWLAIAALVWTPLLVGASYILGNPLIGWLERSGWIVLPLVGGAILIGYRFLKVLLQATSHDGRRLLYGQWLRLVRWEFWPPLPVYLPVFLYVCWLAVRYRSLTVWAAANPGIDPAGGLVMESKSAILKELRAAPEFVARWKCIPAGATGERARAFDRFQENLASRWPIVLKPDIGQRGEGVAVVRTREDALRYLELNPEAVIAQEYVSGREFGVFYYRYPGDAEGRIFSITEKVLPEVVGDGRRTIEQLILDDGRAIALAEHYLKVNRNRLNEIPEAGEAIQLVELGTHCRGAVFLDGNRWKSEALGYALDRVVARFDGFYFGRFDLRVPSGKMLARGKSFRILELNGVSSESTDIYDPKNSIFHAWRILFRQWHLAFRIGAANRRRHAPVPGVTAIVRLLRRHHKRRSFEIAGSNIFSGSARPGGGIGNNSSFKGS